MEFESSHESRPLSPRSAHELTSSALQATQESAAGQPTKRKNEISGDSDASKLEATLQLVRSNLQTALRSVKDAKSVPGKGIHAGRMLELIESSLDRLGKVLTKKGHLVSPHHRHPVNNRGPKPVNQSGHPWLTQPRTRF